MIRLAYTLLLGLTVHCAFGQGLQPGELSFSEYLGYVKKYHPMVRQANLTISSAQAALMSARGAFDPKIEVDFAEKEFKGTEYYSLLNSSFKIPTWYGIEVKAAFDNSEGMYVNPQNTTPNSGLTSLGVSIPLAQGLLINRRMADLRSSKIQLRLSEAERKLQATDAIYLAAIAYFDWKKAFDEVRLYRTYLEFAETRYLGITKLIEAGDKPGIDSIEAGILVKSRKLSLAEASLKLTKARLEMSNFIWIDNFPVELEEHMVPDGDVAASIAEELNLNDFATAAPDVENHPKIVTLRSKLDILEVERRYKANLLLPQLDISYNYLSEPSYFSNYRLEDYKVGLNFSLPIFLRKERGGLRLAKLKIQDGQLDLDLERVALKNKIAARQAEIASVREQKKFIDGLVQDYTVMLQSEERLFSFGESSMFLINSRENAVVSAKLSQIGMENRLLQSAAELFRSVSNPD
ncbi:MAG: TolC family protein [Flavobacterium sp.]